MKRIIDIPEEEYNLIDEWGTRPYLLKLIKNSTPLNSRKMGITINITEGINDYEFYNVPEKVAKAIITLLHECEKDDSTIVSAISER